MKPTLISGRGNALRLSPTCQQSVEKNNEKNIARLYLNPRVPRHAHQQSVKHLGEHAVAPDADDAVQAGQAGAGQHPVAVVRTLCSSGNTCSRVQDRAELPVTTTLHWIPADRKIPAQRCNS